MCPRDRLFACRIEPMGSTPQPQLVFEPLCGIQVDRHRLAVCCAACFAPLGTPSSQLSWAAGALDRVSAACAPHTAPVALPRLGHSSGVSSGGVPCRRACGEVFCTETCLQSGERHGHRLLCVGDVTDESHPLYVFKLAALHSERANTLLLATSLLVRLACAALDGRPLDAHEAVARNAVCSPADATAVDEELRRVHQLWRTAMAASCPPCEAPPCVQLLSEPAFGAAVALVTAHGEDSVRSTPLRRYLRHCLRQPGVSAADASDAVAAVTAAVTHLRSGADDAMADAAADDEDDLEALGCDAYDDGDSAGSDADADPDTPPGMGAILEHLDRLCPPLRVRAVFPYALSGHVRASRLEQNCTVTFDDGVGGDGPLRAYVRPLSGAQLQAGDVAVVDELSDVSPSAFGFLAAAPVEHCYSLARRAAEVGAHEAARQLWQAVLTRAEGHKQRADVPAARGDAWHGLACALLNLGDWTGSHVAFAQGVAEVPHHAALAERATTAAAFGSHPPFPHGGVAVHTVLVSKGRRAVVSASPVLSSQQCVDIVAEAEAKAQARGGWCTQRHYSVPTTDQPLATLPGACAAFNAAMGDAIAPLLHQCFPGTCGGAAVAVHDAFVVKYDAAGGQASLPMHRDQGMLSLTLALNGPPQFTGGGTAFEPLHAAGQPPLCPPPGHVLAFNSSLMHGGAAITGGVRYIIAAFLYVKE